MGSIASKDLKLPSKCRDVSWPSPPIPNLKPFFPKHLILRVIFVHCNESKFRVSGKY